MTPRRPNQRNIGMVFQSYALFPNMTVADNIGFGLKVAGKPKGEIQARVNELLELIRLQELGARYPYQLSGGQQQRVALARALAIRPQLLLLDEPLSALDAKIRVSLRNEIRAIQRHLGITTIYVTHDQEEALSLSDRVVVMNQGKIEQVGTPFEIYNFPQTHFVASFVGTLNILPAKVVDPAQGVIRVAGQTVHTERPLQGTQVGEAVSLALRPELIVIDEPTGRRQRPCQSPDRHAGEYLLPRLHRAFTGARGRCGLCAGRVQQPPSIPAPDRLHRDRRLPRRSLPHPRPGRPRPQRRLAYVGCRS